MSMLKSVTRGRVESPDFIVLYGPDGIGKSTFAASAPKPIFLGTEKGTSNLDVARFGALEKFEDCDMAVGELLREKHDYQTLVVDTLDWLEPLLHQKICRDHGVSVVEESFGGYGKWVSGTNGMWREFLRSLEELRDKKKMNIILLAHAQIKAFQDPQTNTSYDRYQLKLNDKAGALVREIVEAVLFANFEVYTKEDSKKKTRAFGDGSRKMYTQRRPAFDAKNRWNLPYEMPLSWEDLMAGKSAGQAPRSEDIVVQIEELAAQVKDEKTKAGVVLAISKANGNVANLNVILNRLRTLLAA